MILDLIRHGRTAANEQRLYCGSTDLPLSESGAAALTQRYDVPPEPCRYITSGMHRTEQTLQRLYGAVPHEVLPALREMDFGVFEMHSYDQLRHDPAYLAWIDGDNESNPAPGGESGLQMACRVLHAFEQIAADGQNAVIVTHGGVIAAIMAHLFPSEQKNRYEWQCAPGCGYRLTCTNGNWQYIPISHP